jgi:hypothetical protein
MYARSSLGRLAHCSPTAPQILFCACFNYRGQTSLLGSLLNSHPVALEYLMPALTHFYIGTPTLVHLVTLHDLILYRRG